MKVEETAIVSGRDVTQAMQRYLARLGEADRLLLRTERLTETDIERMVRQRAMVVKEPMTIKREVVEWTQLALLGI